jgi:hypothetical protein
MLTRAVGAWLLVGLPVIAARIWWSVAGAVTGFVVTVTMYVAAAVRYIFVQAKAIAVKMRVPVPRVRYPRGVPP